MKPIFSLITALLLAPLAALHAVEPKAQTNVPAAPEKGAELPAQLPASIRLDLKWTAQAAEDAKQDFTSIPFDGKTPNKLACDTTLRELPDGSWVMAMLGVGDTEPRPENHVLLTRSHDKGKTWSPMQPLDFGFPREGDTIAMVPSELMVLKDRCTLFFATHDGTFAGWKEWMTHSDDSCLTWSKPAPAPGRLHDRTFIRNHIFTKDGRILLPFQHYKRVKETKAIDGGRRLSEPTDSRNGVLISADGGKTWTEHGDIRISKDDTYHGWAENNIAELADGRIAMIIRADRLGGVLYYAESKDGGKTWPEFAAKSDIPNPGSKATLYPLGGDTVALLHNPNPKGRHPLALWISFDGMKTWPYQRVLVEHSSDGPGRSLNYPDGFVSADKQWLHFAYDDNRHRAVHYSAKLPAMPTADPDATPQARSVLAYLHSLRQRTDNRVLLGQFLGYPNRNEIPGNSFSLAPAEAVFQRTGKWPALVGADYSGRTVLDYTNHRDLSYETVNPVLKAYAKAGGLITICVHHPSPFPPYGLRDTGADLRQLLQPGPVRDTWLKQLDYVASGLADLQSSGVVVLFRPLHEYTRTGMWWSTTSASATPDYHSVYRQVWIDLFDYFTKTKQLHNLLWVWNPKENQMNSYPGSGYVDIVGPYNYDGDFGDRYETNFAGDFSGMLQTGKVFGVQETGPADATAYDARKLICVVREKGPQTAYILVWHDPIYRLANMQHLEELVNDEWIATRDELPDFSQAP